LAGIAEADPPARKSDLAQHRRQRRGSPIALLAVAAALKRPADRKHAAGGGHAPGKAADGLGLDPGDCRRPVRILGLSVAFAHEIAAEALEAGAIALDEGPIVQRL